MPSYHASTGDVRFDHALAQALAQELRGTAVLIEHQLRERAQAAQRATDQWRGVYRDEFDDRFLVCIQDGQMLADELRRKASELDRKAADARAEQSRRERARREAEEYANRNLLEKAIDWVFGG